MCQHLSKFLSNKDQLSDHLICQLSHGSGRLTVSLPIVLTSIMFFSSRVKTVNQFSVSIKIFFLQLFDFWQYIPVLLWTTNLLVFFLYFYVCQCLVTKCQSHCTFERMHFCEDLFDCFNFLQNKLMALSYSLFVCWLRIFSFYCVTFGLLAMAY